MKLSPDIYIYFKISDSFIYKQSDTFYAWTKCFDRTADFGKEFLSGKESVLNSMTFNKSLTQDLLIHCQGYGMTQKVNMFIYFREILKWAILIILESRISY